MRKSKPRKRKACRRCFHLGAEHRAGDVPARLRIDGGSRVLLAAGVDDVDVAYEELKSRGVEFLRPPPDQPCELRTAYFADPEGNLWESNQPLES